MKRHPPAMPLATLLLSSATLFMAHAEAQPESSWRVAADLSFGKVSNPCAAGRRCSPVELSGRWRLGYAWDPNWSVELASLPVESEWGLGAAGAARVRGTGASLVYSKGLSEQWAVFGRVGFAHLRGRYRPEGGVPAGPEQSNTSPWLGGGLRWQFTPHWHLEAHADWARVDLRFAPSAGVTTRTVRWSGLGISLRF